MHPPPFAVRVMDRCADRAIIGVKPVSSKPCAGLTSDPATTHSANLLGRHALPGLATSSPAEIKQEDKPDRSPSTPLSPRNHTRIPSTGNRATVMDVAHAWNEQRVALPYAIADSETAAAHQEEISQDESPAAIEKLAEAMPQPRKMIPMQVEQRKSSYEKYSAVILPPLLEEKTPASSPASTLPRNITQEQPEHLGTDKYGLQNKLVTSSASTLQVVSQVDTKLVHFSEAHYLSQLIQLC